MKEVLGFSVNGTQSLRDPGFFVAQVKLQREKWCLGVRRTFCPWLGLRQIAELRKQLIPVVRWLSHRKCQLAFELFRDLWWYLCVAEGYF